MTTRSFRQDSGPRPLRYRTPSPPTSAVESLSPPFTEGSPTQNSGMRWPNKRSYQSSVVGHSDSHQSIVDTDGNSGARQPQGAMDAFASIALSTSLDVAPRRSSHQEQAGSRSGMVFACNSSPEEPPAKRARSEKLPSPQSRRTGVDKRMRPATSGQSSDDRMLEAELLLNFAQEARFSVPPLLHRQEDVQANPQSIMSPISSGRRSKQSAQKEWHKDDTTDTMNIYTNSNKGPTRMRSTYEAFGELRHRTWGQTLQPGPRRSSSGFRAAIVKNEPLTTQDEVDTALEGQATTKSAIDFTAQEPTSYRKYETPAYHTEPMRQDSQDRLTQEKTNSCQAQDVMGRKSPITTPQLSEHGGFPSLNYSESYDHSTDPLPNGSPTQMTNLSPDDSVVSTITAQRPGFEPKPAETDRGAKVSDLAAPAVCAGCGFTRNIVNGEFDTSPTSWISCDACKSWFHFACAGFKNEREVRSVDKYRCRRCKPTQGPTTYVRKSSRAHSSIDYAGLHQGVIKTSDDTPEHHYIQPIKEGTISFLPESFARMRPELVTAEYLEQCHGWKEPIVIPAAFNPQPRAGSTASKPTSAESKEEPSENAAFDGPPTGEWAFDGSESQFAPDHGQDALDMVMPQGLTVKAVAELYGPEEKVEVIDVKSQNGEGKKWNMRRWADYYESKGNKVVRNVISLEVSQSKLGRLIRRPQIVRDLDLQDSVWPAELQAKGEIPRVQFYCLMSVADCFTDFHIDFGGSSVFYHILKGRKTFFFIPPKEKHLKKYEEWCLSPAQNWTFLGGQTRECYRVDLSQGDTMLIPAGWIHAVWTPEDSLVIGGNFLTRLNYGMQLRIAQIEKATGVARKFRYPHFQKIHWYTAFRYLEEDPLPTTVKELLQGGGVFDREMPSHYGFNDWGENSRPGPENYHARYYPQAELEGLPELVRYLLRTALIDMGSITDGITAETRNAVKRSIPRGHGEPLDVVKALAAWCAWKRGNETIPAWAYPDAVPEPESAAIKSVTAQRKLDREAALQAPRRQSARMQSLRQSSVSADGQFGPDSKDPNSEVSAVNAGDRNNNQTPTKHRYPDYESNDPTDVQCLSTSKRRRTVSGIGSNSHRKVACDSCRKRRRACKHKDTKNVPHTEPQAPSAEVGGMPSPIPSSNSIPASGLSNGIGSIEATPEHIGSGESETLARVDPNITMQQLMDLSPEAAALTDSDRERLNTEMDYLLKHPNEIASTPKMLTHLSGAGLLRLEHRIAGGPVNGLSVLSLNAPHSRGRTKACNDCRKSKRRCIHDEHGNEDPVKAREAAMPRPAAMHKRKKLDSEGNEIPWVKRTRKSAGSTVQDRNQQSPNDAIDETPRPQRAPMANMVPASSGEKAPDHTQNDILSAFGQMQAVVAMVDTGYEDGMNVTKPLLDVREDGPTVESKPAPSAPSETPVMDPTPDIPPETSIPSVIASTPPDSKTEILHEEAFVTSTQSAAALASPPASEPQDISNTPPSPAATSSRQSSHQPKHQRYTPESGCRRASSSSANEAAEVSESGRMSSGPMTATKEISPITTISTTGEDERKEIGSVSAEKGKLGSSMEGIADEESLKLIKELQAEEYGLRRRGRASG